MMNNLPWETHQAVNQDEKTAKNQLDSVFSSLFTIYRMQLLILNSCQTSSENIDTIIASKKFADFTDFCTPTRCVQCLQLARYMHCLLTRYSTSH